MLAGVSLALFLCVAGALGAFYGSSLDDATAIAACRVASTVSASVCEAAGTGSVSASLAIDLPGLVCGMPYIVYPSRDGRSMTIDVISGGSARRYSAPLPLRADGVHIDGFIASPPDGHRARYDAFSRTVTLA